MTIRSQVQHAQERPSLQRWDRLAEERQRRLQVTAQWPA